MGIGREKALRSLRKWAADSPLEPLIRPFYQAFARGRSATYDRETRLVIRRVLAEDSNAIDVGAHRGTILREIVRRAPRGRHTAIEPVPRYAARLRDRFPTVLVHEVALGDGRGVEPFLHVEDDPGLSGFRKHPRVTPHHRTTSITVEVERLDDIVPGDVTPALIKIDVEGAEIRVLRGGANTIRRSRPFIIFECGLGVAGLYEDFSPEAMYALIDSLGLRVSTMRRWLAGDPPLDEAGFVGSLEHGRDYYYLAYP